ncbi:hypothetical protein H2279_08365 [Campylobacter sp. B0100352/1]|uniref:hypothetical protein n=1 Tax=Campylobacter sp. B0100352/1 TaxID=2735783 RepID=UPI001D264924|nr:hypothetical protein [Campylobacter sp. B0100352/1]
MTPLTTKDTIVCPHNGKVVLKSSLGKNLTANHTAQTITKNDLLDSDIIGCTRTMAGVKVPCTKVTSVESVSGLININNDNIVVCEKLNLSSTDKGFALSLKGKAFLENKMDIT